MLKKFLIGTFAAIALMAFTSASAYDFGTTTLKVGSKGPAVVAVQTLVGANADGNFGPMTKAKVMAWQAANGLTADGIFGNMSKAKANGAVSGNFPAGCTSAAGYSSTTGQPCAAIPSTVAGCQSGAMYSSTTGQLCSGTTPTAALAGTAGTISTFTKLSQYSGEEVSEGSKDVKVLGFETKASKDGDISLNSARLKFTITNASGSTRLTDYLSNVTVWQGSTKVGSALASDFNKDSSGVYSKIVTLSNAIVRADSTQSFYVTVDGQSGLDSGDIDSEVMTIDLENVRYADGSGVVTTEATAGDLPITGVSIAMVSFATSADTKLKISTDSTPLSTVVLIDDTNDTNNVTLLKGKMVLEGTSNVLIDTLPITFTAANGGADAVVPNAEAVASSVKLTIAGKEFTKTMTAGAGAVVVTFDNLDLTVNAGSTVNFTVTADINDTNNTGAIATDLDEGDTLKAELLAANRTAMDAENAQGDQLVDSTEKTGTAVGEAMSFYVDGISVKLSGTPTAVKTFTADAAGEDDQGTFTIGFDVTANGADLFIDKSSEVDGASTATGSYTLADAAVLAGETYTATINGTAVVYTALAGDAAGTDAVDTLAIMTGLAAAIDADGTVGPLVNATVVDAAGTTTINLVAVASGSTGNYTTTASDTSAGGTLVATAAAMAGGVNNDVAGQGVEFAVTATAGTPALSSNLLESNTTDTLDTATDFIVKEGATRHFTLTVIYTADTTPTDGSAYVSLSSINWGTANDGSNANYYTFNLGDYKTPSLFLNAM